MNTPGLDFLTLEERDQLRADASSLIGDSDVTKALTFTVRSAPTRNLSTGAVTENVSTDSVNGIVRLLEEDLGQGTQLGDVEILVAAADMALDGNAADGIIEGAVVYNILSAEKDQAGIVWRFHCRREGTK